MFMESYEVCFGVKDTPRLCYDSREGQSSTGVKSSSVDVLFFDPSVSRVGGQLVGKLYGGEPIYFYSDMSLDKGMHFIDWVDGEFLLISLRT